VYDESFLTEEQKQYLEKAPNMQEYVDGLELLAKKALFYSKKKEWIQMRADFYREQMEEKISEDALLGLQLNGFR
jgi:hypothetical protein